MTGGGLADGGLHPILADGEWIKDFITLIQPHHCLRIDLIVSCKQTKKKILKKTFCTLFVKFSSTFLHLVN